VDGAVTSLSLVANGTELLVGTETGRVYRMLTADLTSQLVAVGHTDKVTCVAFGSRSDVFASGTQKGNVKVWDLSDYGVLSETTVAGENGVEGGVASICWVGDEAVVTGWHDTFVRCHDASTMQCLWEIPNAHRGAVMSVAAHSDASLSYLLSGGSDGSVRVWALRSREMMLQFVEHQKSVTQVLVDVKSPNLVHSAGADCQVLTYDLRRERRTVAHLTREGAFTGMTQRLDSEQELVTCDLNGRLLFWDCDVPEPVQALQSPSRMHMQCASVSPTGRYLAICGDFMVSIFDLSTGIRLIAQGHGHSEPVSALQWSPDEKQVVSVGEDCCVCVWNFYNSPADE
jgi:WD40 repeat protein